MKAIVLILFFIFAIDFRSFGLANNDHAFGEDQFFRSEILPKNGSSPWLVRYRVLIPKNYGTIEAFSVVYFLHGRNGDRFVLESLDVLKQMDLLSDKVGRLRFIIVEPECGSCYWMNAAGANERWGDVITQELIQDVESKYRVVKEPRGRLIAGISMGGHGAIQLTLNHPNIFGFVAAHSPVFRTEEETISDFSKQFGRGEDFKNRDPFSLILLKNKKISTPLWMDIGGSDKFFPNTKKFSELLMLKFSGLDLHVGEDMVGGHFVGYWKYHLYSYLQWYSLQLTHATSN